MEKEKKYKLTEETIEWYDHTLYRIEAIRSFADVKAGDLGGWVESESNLSHDGNAWIYDNAKVYDNALVYDDANISGNAKVFKNAEIYDNAKVFKNAEIYDNAKVFKNAEIYDNAVICNNAEIYDNAWIFGNAKVCNEAIVTEFVRVLDDAVIYNKVHVSGNAIIRGDARVGSMHDYIVFKNHFSSGIHFTWTRSNDMWSVGCFYGTGEELIKKAYQDNDKKGKFYEAYVNFVEQLKEVE